jgi:hypothetical protein
MHRVLVVGMLFVVLSCYKNEKQTCTPGMVAACACGSGESGAQTCMEDGTFGPCTGCPGGSGQGGAGGGTVGGGTGGSLGGSDCAIVGGETLPTGACFKKCTAAAGKPGTDLFGDCTAMKLICQDSQYGYCTMLNCQSDADCGWGLKCIVASGVHTCQPPCQGNADCPTSRGIWTCVLKPPGEGSSSNWCKPPDW